ncbi:hypothetical protein [Mucilaginibacter sp. PPCGB 2223]|uniref:hypothetical protein n=1 Tax=Mucilaginibacter sp. PPCGB 2223 TaxID=1886027 RepID=UPI00111230D2|nr:hypothetical protein [Mucilaginibacter sp. PPCGB 2223]
MKLISHQTVSLFSPCTLQVLSSASLPVSVAGDDTSKAQVKALPAGEGLGGANTGTMPVDGKSIPLPSQ